MRRGRAFVDSTVVGASLALLLGPRRGMSRRVALSRLRAALRPGSGSLEAFGGTPCAQQRPGALGQAESPDLAAESLGATPGSSDTLAKD